MTECLQDFTVGGLVRGARFIDLGPTHPSSAGLLRGTLTLSDATVIAIDPEPGALHRGAELLFAARDYRQALSLANRHDWQAPFFGEWVLAKAVEEALGIDVPPRARWLRALQAERTRILSHLAYLSHVATARRDPTLDTHRLREDFRRSTAAWAGHRLHPMIVRLGGVGSELPPGWLKTEKTLWSRASDLGARLGEASASLGVGVAPVTTEIINAYGLSGPIARASGVSTDLRRSHPEPPYTDLGERRPVSAPNAGDAAARFGWLAAEIIESVELLRRLTDTAPTGALTAHLPKVVKLPDGDTIATVEAPLGRASIVLTSRGEKTPWRLRLRTPSAACVASWEAAVPGTLVEDLPTALASLPWVAGDLDK
ncbi:MAG: NADH-quinone oxidoreductase subunit D [Propioniciclava sp.]